MQNTEWLLGWLPAALTAKRSEMREVDMAWVDYSIWEPRMTRKVDMAWVDTLLE